MNDEIGLRQAEGVVEEIRIKKYPAVKLDTDKITAATAGRLTASLLGHVLFLKNQVPFPVMQLGRLPGGKTSTRAAKNRAELLASFDTISSHLDTTFSALSTALAQCSQYKSSEVAQAHLAILVGPSLGSAKSKVILGIDGLETIIWGQRRDSLDSRQCSDENDELEGDGTDDSDEGSIEGSDGDEDVPEDSDGEDDEEKEESEEDDDTTDDALSSPLPYISHAEELKFLQHADRLLSRTLATADADGNGISSEMTPTQTHILLRAPRRFNHPAWIPRQNVMDSLESALQNFLDISLGSQDIDLDSQSRRAKRSKVEGIWITTRAGLHPPPSVEATTHDSQRTENDDMIWWNWDGKFVGFADW